MNNNSSLDLRIHCYQSIVPIPFQQHYDFHYYIYIILYILLAVLSFILNGAMLITLTGYIEFRTPSFALLKLLTMIDGSNAVTSTPLHMAALILAMNGKLDCKLYVSGMTVFSLFCNISLMMTFIISCDRYMAIFFPFWYIRNIDKIIEWYYRSIIATLIILLAVITPLNLMVHHALDFYETSNALIILISHVYIYMKIRKQVKELRKRNKNKRHSENGKNLLTFAIVLSLYLCHLPRVAINLSEMLREYNGICNGCKSSYTLWAQLLMFCNSIINPLLYCFAMNGIRKKMKKRFFKRNRTYPVMQNTSSR